MKFTKQEKKWMNLAFNEAAKGRYHVQTNPCVGCVIVHNNSLVASGYHEKIGGPHAEVNALNQFDRILEQTNLNSAECTLYITLEPCSHSGPEKKTPACAPRVGSIKWKEVIIASVDPNQKVQGKGIQYLRDQGIKVRVGLLSEENQKLNSHFDCLQTKSRPFFMAKIAQSLEGTYALNNGHSQWITGPEAKEQTMKLRAQSQIVLTSGETYRMDSPQLTVRGLEDPGLECGELSNDNEPSSPVPIVISKKLKSDQCRFPIIDISKLSNQELIQYLREVASAHELELGTVMIESGRGLIQEFIQRKLLDRLHIYLAPNFLGPGRSWDFPVQENFDSNIAFNHCSWTQLGQDMWFQGDFSFSSFSGNNSPCLQD